MFSHDFAVRVLRSVDELIATALEQAARGAPSDWGQYQRLVGQISGLRQAREQIVAPFNERERSELPRAP